MNEELRELYQLTIVDHSSHPRRKGEIEGADQFEGTNARCGDKVMLFIERESGIMTVKFTGRGCAISQASASLLAENVNGMHVEEARELFSKIKGTLLDGEHPELPRKLAALQAVPNFPSRVKCAYLAWQALEVALNAYER